MTREEEIEKAVFDIYNGEEDVTDMGLAKFGRLCAEWADEHPKNPWISVEDRLPEEFQMVFVHMQGGSCDSALYTSGAFERNLQLKFGMKDEGYTIISWEQKFKSNITHWMPIPETPKGGEE